MKEEFKKEIESKLEKNNLKIASITKRAIAMTIDDFLVSFLIIISFFDAFKSTRSMEEIMILTDKLFLKSSIFYLIE